MRALKSVIQIHLLFYLYLLNFSTEIIIGAIMCLIFQSYEFEVPRPRSASGHQHDHKHCA